MNLLLVQFRPAALSYTSIGFVKSQMLSRIMEELYGDWKYIEAPTKACHSTKGLRTEVLWFKGLGFIVQWTRGSETENLPLSLSPDSGLTINSVRIAYRRKTENALARTQFVTSSSLTTQKMIELFNQVVLTPEETLLQEALQTIEPKIERIASVSPPSISPQR